MMADNSDLFRPDVFLQALKELQKEKDANEQVLKQTREEKRLLEYRLQEVDQSYSTVKNKKTKMNEMKEVAERKLAKNQEVFERVTSKNEAKLATLQELMKAISEERTKQSEQVMELESRLDILANQFRHAKHYYMDESLSNQIGVMKEKRDELQSEASAEQDVVVELNQKLNSMGIADQQELHNGDRMEWSDGMDVELVLQLFEDERVRIINHIEHYREELEQVYKNNENLLQECQQLEQETSNANLSTN